MSHVASFHHYHIGVVFSSFFLIRKTNVNMKKLHTFTHFLTVMPVTWQREAHQTRLPASFLRLSVSFGENDAHPNICEAAAPPRASSCPAAVKFCLSLSRDVSSKLNKKKGKKKKKKKHDCKTSTGLAGGRPEVTFAKRSLTSTVCRTYRPESAAMLVRGGGGGGGGRVPSVRWKGLKLNECLSDSISSLCGLLVWV